MVHAVIGIDLLSIAMPFFADIFYKNMGMKGGTEGSLEVRHFIFCAFVMFIACQADCVNASWRTGTNVMVCFGVV